MGQKYPKYRWGRNKGYGTKLHCQAILKYGICDQHRTLFVDGIIASRGQTSG